MVVSVLESQLFWYSFSSMLYSWPLLYRNAISQCPLQLSVAKFWPLGCEQSDVLTIPFKVTYFPLFLFIVQKVSAAIQPHPRGSELRFHAENKPLHCLGYRCLFVCLLGSWDSRLIEMMSEIQQKVEVVRRELKLRLDSHRDGSGVEIPN